MENYIYNDEDNQPMNEENMPESLKKLFQNFNDRDCPNCIHKMPNGDCNSWDCKFEPKGGEA